MHIPFLNCFFLIFRDLHFSNGASYLLLIFSYLCACGSEHLKNSPTTTPRRMKVSTVPRRRTRRTEEFASAVSCSCLIGYPTFWRAKELVFLVRKLSLFSVLSDGQRDLLLLQMYLNNFVLVFLHVIQK